MPNTIQHTTADDEIDLGELFSTLWKEKYFIITTAISASIIAAIISFFIPNSYQAYAIVAPSNNDTQGGGALSGGLSSLAALSGLSSGGAQDKTTLALETLQSRAFIQNFIKSHDLLAEIIATKGWDNDKKVWIFDTDLFDPATGKWATPDTESNRAERTLWDAYKIVKQSLTVEPDRKTGLVKIGLELTSPQKSFEWLTWLIADINNYIREIDIKNSTSRISYLKKQIDKTPIADMQKVFYQLIEQETKTLMLAELSSEYVLKYVDPAIVPEDRSRPNRKLITAVGLAIGLLLGIVIALFRKSNNNSDS